MISSIQKRRGIRLPSDFLKLMIHHSADYLTTAFCDYFPPAYHYRDEELQQWIALYFALSEESDGAFAIRDIYRLIKRYGARGFALENMGYRPASLKEGLSMLKMEKISPVPLRKNFSAAKLPNFTMLLRSIARGEKVAVDYLRYR